MNIKEALKLFGLKDYANRHIYTHSSGLRKKAILALTLLIFSIILLPGFLNLELCVEV